MIVKNSNIVICQLELIKETENLLNLIKVTQNEFLEDVNKQHYPLIYELCLEDLVKRSSYLEKKIKVILENIKAVV